MAIRIQALELRSRPVYREASGGWPSVPELLLQFAASAPPVAEYADGATRTPSTITFVQIVGVLPKSLRAMEIRRQGQTKLKIGCVSNGRGGLVTAGEMIEAMAKEFGQEGLTVDVASLNLDFDATDVSLVVTAADSDAAEQARVVIIATS